MLGPTTPLITTMPKQTRLTGFLSPVASSTGPCSQSLPCGQVSPAPASASQPVTESGSPLPDLPTRAGRKSKKTVRAEKKSKRKREKKAIGAKSKTCTSDNVASTPVRSTNDTVMSDDDLLNRSLRSMLASGDEGSHGDSACSSDQNGDSQHLIQVESQLVATAIALEGERNEVARLNTHIELLEKEYSAQKRELQSMTKTANKQKS